VTKTGAEGIRKLSLTCICNRCHTSKAGQSSYAALAGGGIIAPFSLAIFAHAATCESTGREIGTKKSSARYAPRRSLRRAPMQSFARQLAGKRRTAPSNLTRKRSFARYARSCSLRSAPMQSFVRMLAGKRRTASSNFARIDAPAGSAWIDDRLGDKTDSNEQKSSQSETCCSGAIRRFALSFHEIRRA
jgi:hypothetical protein